LAKRVDKTLKRVVKVDAWEKVLGIFNPPLRKT
jgi:hypothetical protein